MRITWLGLACFLVEGADVKIVTDPYLAPDFGYRATDVDVDVVIRSSPDDLAHSSVETLRPGFELVEALEVAKAGPTTIRGVPVEAFRSRERLVRGKDDPDENAMYRFTVDGVRILHLGDTGHPFHPDHIDALRDQVDVMLAITGDNYTIPIDDLMWGIEQIRPRVVIPMHYQDTKLTLPRGFWFYPLEAFITRYPAEAVTRRGESHIDVTPETLPPTTRIVVLEAAN
jgi:L-ascorbate metabolism protein UlaG (beta-lactamase superfamily)